MFVRCMCVRPSGFAWTITCTIMHGFQNNLAQSALEEEKPFETFYVGNVEGQGRRGQINIKMVINCACPGHNWYFYAWILK